MNWNSFKISINRHPHSNRHISEQDNSIGRKITVGVLTLLFSVLSFSAHSARTDGAWVWEGVPSSVRGHHETNHGADMVLDPTGRAQVVFGQTYVNGSFHDTKVHLATRLGMDDWQRRYVAYSGYASLGRQVMVDYTPQGNICVAYSHNYDGSLTVRCAPPESNQWVNHLVLENGSMYAMAMTFGNDEDVHLIYARSHKLFYHHGNATPEIVDASPNSFGWGGSVATDADGVPHVAYFVDYADTARTRQLRYAKRTPYGWRVWVVDSDRKGAQGNLSLSIDSDGRPVIAYYHDLSDQLRTVHLVDGSWQRDVVTTGLTNYRLTVGAAVVMRLDAQDRRHIVYNELYDLAYTVLDDTGSHPKEISFDKYNRGPLTHPHTFDMVLDSNNRPNVVIIKSGYVGFYHRSTALLGELANTVPVNNLAAPAGHERTFTFEVPEGADRLRIESQGGTGNADLSVRYADAPAGDVSDCASTNLDNVETCSFDHPTAGTWYITLRAESAYADVNLVAINDIAKTLVHDKFSRTKSAVAGKEWFFKIEVPAGQDLLTLDTGNVFGDGVGDVDLYVRRGAIATTDSYDCVSSALGVNHETCTIINPQAGTWYMTLGTQSYMDQYNHAVANYYADPAQELYNGIAMYDLTGNWGSQKFFKIWVAENASVLDVVMSGTTKGVGVGADLYVRRESLPTESNYDCRPFWHGSTLYEETCSLPNPVGGYWYVMIRGNDMGGYSGLSYKGINLRAMTY